MIENAAQRHRHGKAWRHNTDGERIPPMKGRDWLILGPPVLIIVLIVGWLIHNALSYR